MGVMDKFISAMKLSEDEDDGYYDDDFYDEDPMPARKPAAKEADGAEDKKDGRRYGSLRDQAYHRRGCQRNHRDAFGKQDGSPESGRA